MINISYDEYVTNFEKRLGRYKITDRMNPCYINWYEFKYNFIKPSRSNVYAVKLFKCYMHDDIYIDWDIKNDKD